MPKKCGMCMNIKLSGVRARAWMALGLMVLAGALAWAAYRRGWGSGLLRREPFEGMTDEDASEFDPMLAPVPERREEYQHPLKSYYVYGSFQSCAADRAIEGGEVSVDALKKVVQRGVRVIDLDLFMLDGRVVVGISNGKSVLHIGSANTIPLDDALHLLREYAFSAGLTPTYNDPLFLNLRVHSMLAATYESIASKLKASFRTSRLAAKYGYNNGDRGMGDVPLNELQRKLVVMTDIDSYKRATDSFKRMTNIVLKTGTAKALDNSEVRNYSSVSELVEFNKQRLTLTHPSLGGNQVSNDAPAPHLESGCQMVLMTHAHENHNLAKYTKVFADAGHAIVLKPEHLRAKEIVLEEPKPQNPKLGLGTKTCEGGLCI
jgi:hypothetical protein